MNYGLNIAASGALTSMHRQDVLTNNLANVNTIGFKPDSALTMHRDAARIEDDLHFLPSNQLLEQLGAGVLLAPTRTSFTQGAIQKTDNPFDVAIEGDGFLTVQTRDENDRVATHLTRDGRMTLNDDGTLVLATTGLRVLDETGNPIVLDASGSVTISTDGVIAIDGEPIARLGFIDVPDRTALTKKGDGQFALDPQALRAARPATGNIRQYAVEAAAVDQIDAMMSITSASRDFGANISMISHFDRTMDSAINRFGRVS